MENREWRVDLALSGLDAFLYALCIHYAYQPGSVYDGSGFERFARNTMHDIRTSKEWLSYLERLEILAETESPDEDPQPPVVSETREQVILKLLKEKGWSILDWANEAEVAYHTAADYLYGKKKPFRSTRLKLAKALGISVNSLPD